MVQFLKFMGVKFHVVDVGSKARKVDESDTLVIKNGSKSNLVRVVDFIGDSRFDRFGSPATRLKKIRQQSTFSVRSNRHQGLGLPIARTLENAARKFNVAWHKRVRASTEGILVVSKVIPRGGEAEKTYSGPKHRTYFVRFNNPHEAASNVRKIIDRFLKKTKGWTAQKIFDFNRNIYPKGGERIRSLYLKGKFPDTIHSGSIPLYLPPRGTPI